MENKKRMSKAVFNNMVEYINKHNLDIQYGEICEPGYDKGLHFFADWNTPSDKRSDIHNHHWAKDGKLNRAGIERKKTSKIGKWLKTYEGYEDKLEWSDKWARCDDCNEFVRTSPDCHGWLKYYHIFKDSTLSCGNCTKDNVDIDDLLEEFGNNPHTAIHEWLVEVFEENGFEESDEYFETGLHHGQDDKPEDVAKSIPKTVDYVFYISGTGQFEVNWTFLTRKNKHVLNFIDDNREFLKDYILSESDGSNQYLNSDDEDDEIEEWVINDEYLYNWALSEDYDV